LLGIPENPDDRSPSPEPIYNGDGKRMNTREYRTRKKLEELRHDLINQMQEINPDYSPPMDYKPMLQRVSERVAIPVDGNPAINFVGLLIGPRGNTLKKIEKESDCKIMIRGKGSVKEGKVFRKDGNPLPGEDEPLHALVSSTKIENVKKAVAQIQQIIKAGIEQPEQDNGLRKLQLQELAKLNGTLREDLMPRERQWLKPENQNITNTTICQKCGGRGHLAQDCISGGQMVNYNGGPPMGGGPRMGGPPAVGMDRAKMDSEYDSLMRELGEGSAPAANSNNNPPQQPSGPRGPRPGMFGPPRPGFGGPRPPWMGRGGPRGFNGPPRFRHDGPGGFNNGPPPPGAMGRGNRPPPPWMQQNNQQQGGQWQPGGQQQGGYQQQPGYQQQGGYQQQQGGYGNFGSGFNPPPPPPAGGNQQPPPPPTSGGDVTSQYYGGNQQQQQQWSGQQQQYGGGQGDASSQQGSYGNWGNPPMPSGPPGPVPPPPPSSESATSAGNYGGNAAGGGFYGNMPPPPPPPQ